jgi:glycosyltransferase involved in cell wall biosynthesis
VADGADSTRRLDAADEPFRPAVLIPGYECATTIAAVVADARAQLEDVLVVDDGSRDDTAERARLAGAEVIRHSSNRGKGAALVTGMRQLADAGFTHALSMDGDGQHLGREIPTLLAAASAERSAIVIGARMIGDQAVAATNLFGNWFANSAAELAAGVPLGDTQSGFRVYPLATVLGLPIDGDRFEYETTVIIRAARAGVPIRSTPTRVYYPPVAERRSHYRKVADTLRIIRAVAPLLLRR